MSAYAPSSASKVLSLVLAAVLTVGLMPLPASASSDMELESVQAQQEELSGGNAVHDEANHAEEDGAEEHHERSDATGGSGEGSDTSSDAATFATASDGDVENPTASSGDASSALQTKESAPAALALAENAYLLIQSQKDQNSAFSYVSGATSAGTTLWANMYEPTGYYGADVVPAEDGWQYQWLMSDAKSGNAGDFEPIAGATEQSYTVSEDVAGKFIAVKVTVDGVDFFGPRTSSTTTDINMNYLPGPIMGAGMAELYKVSLSNSSPSVGETLTATAYTSYSTPAGEGVNVTYTWQQGDSRYGSFADIEGAGNGNTFTLTEAQQGKYIKVIASAGVNEESTTTDAVMAEGAIKLAGVEIEAPASLQMPVTLTAKAYTGSLHSPTYVDNSKVTYTWKYAKTDSPSYSTTWTTIDGETGPTLTISDEKYAGCCFTVAAVAGANEVELSYYSAVGPVKLAGQVDISSVVIQNKVDGTSVFCVGDTAVAKAREKGAATGVYIDPANLNYQWQVADAKGGPFADIADATGEELAIGASLEGKYIQCVVSSRIGSSTYTRSVSLPIAKTGSINVSSVTLDKSGKVNIGDTITATASAAQGDVTDKVSWSWYGGDSSYDTETKITGANTNTLKVPAELNGKYIEARADGGFGDEDSAAVGPVVAPGSVGLYKVTAEGAPKVGNILTATAYKDGDYSYVPVASSDTVSYQWQYADTKTTQDTAFKDIANATQASYAIEDSMVGKYLRVVATSENEVVSTVSPSYYGETKVDPLGPVTLAGQYTLTGVELASSGQAAQVGNTITPTALVAGEYYGDDPAPDDAKLTFSWQVQGAGGWETLDAAQYPYDASDGALELDAALEGKTLCVQASALDNTVISDSFTVLPAGTYNLLRVTTSPSINSTYTTLLTGDTVTASVQARGLDSTSSYGDDVTGDVDIRWYVADAPDGEFSPLDGATSASLVIPDSAAGKYLKVVAKSGGSEAELVGQTAVVGSDSLAGVVAKLESESVRLSPVYGEDTNVNEMLEAEITELGFDGVNVQVKEAEFSTTSDAVTVGISAADDNTNGDITFANFLPENASSWGSYTSPRQASITFVLSREGEDPVEFTPSLRSVIPWDEAAVAETLQTAAQQLAIGYADGDSAESVTQDVTLPHSIEAVSWSTSVSWSSDSEVISVEGYSWDDESTGAVARSAEDQQVTLTATVGFGGSDVPETIVEVPFTVTVKADAFAIEEATAELQEKIDAAFTADALTYFEDGSKVDCGHVHGDLQLPRTSALDIDGKYYSVVYSASTTNVQVNGYKGNVYQPLPDAGAAIVELTLTVTSKENSAITASKTIELFIEPLDESDIENELALMAAAKEGYAAALAAGQEEDAITADLDTFQKAYFDENGTLAWARNYTEAEDAGYGIIPDELPGYDDMGTQGWRTFRSSNSAIIAHETLLLAGQPEYNTEVTVDSVLSSEKYARYAEYYAGDATWGSTFAQLVDQPVSATFKVTGRTGIDDPNAGQEPETLSVDVKVTGIAAEKQDGKAVAETWIPLTEMQVEPGTNVTAWDLFAKALDGAGYTYSLDGWVPYSVTSPDGRTLAMSDSAPWSYWSFILNGEYATQMANAYEVQDGDSIELVYVDGSGVTQPEGDVTLNPDAEHPDLDAAWGGYANGGAGAVLDGVATATEGTELDWKASLLTDEERAAGASCAYSDPLILGGKIYVVSGSSTYDANNNRAETKSLARLQVIDPATGKVESSVTLARGLDSQCRMVYGNGIIVVPLAGGYLQALSASTFETMWVLPAIDGAQSVSSLTVSGDYVYVATADTLDSSWMASSGTVRRVNLLTGALAGSQSNNQAGYYWAGGITVGDYFLIGDDAGEIEVYDAAFTEGAPALRYHFTNAAVRSTLVESDGFIYAVTNDGVLHKFQFADGTLSEVGSVKFAASSTSTPAIADGKAYVGGAEADYTGVLAVIDVASMKADRTVTTFASSTAKGQQLPADVKSAPLVSQQSGGTYVYFTCNNLPGGLYVYKEGDAEAVMMYLPDAADQNYSMSSVFAGADGTLYYINDSGTLFALVPGGELPAYGGGQGSDQGGDTGTTGNTGSDGDGDQGSGMGNQDGKRAVAAPLILMGNPTASENAAVQVLEAAQGESVAAAANTDGDGAQSKSVGEDGLGGTSSDHAAGIPFWLPLLGIIVGVAGLVTVVLWVAKSRRRS